MGIQNTEYNYTEVYTINLSQILILLCTHIQNTTKIGTSLWWQHNTCTTTLRQRWEGLLCVRAVTIFRIPASNQYALRTTQCTICAHMQVAGRYIGKMDRNIGLVTCWNVQQFVQLTNIITTPTHTFFQAAWPENYKNIVCENSPDITQYFRSFQELLCTK